MAQQTLANLEDDELLHLAIEAMQKNQHGDAIAYLKQAVEKSQTNHNALYLLAAEHAQIGLTDRAIEEFNRALAIKPSLVPARFQLGLLMLCNARVQEALSVLEPLDRLPDTDPYLHFKRGLACLTRDEFDACKKNIERGIALNGANPILSRDMQSILALVEAHSAKDPSPTPHRAGSDRAGQLLLSAYTKDSSQI
jgi:Flp pilus assembly protein TadD